MSARGQVVHVAHATAKLKVFGGRGFRKI